MEKNQERKDITTLTEMNAGGCVEEWKKHTYSKKIFFISASGLITPFPDDLVVGALAYREDLINNGEHLHREGYY